MKTELPNSSSPRLSSDSVSDKLGGTAAVSIPALTILGISVVTTVQAELAQRRSQPDFRLSNEIELAAQFNVHPSTIKRLLRSLDPTDLAFWRSNVVRPDKRTNRKIKDNVVEHCRTELRRFQAGKIDTLSSEKEIAAQCKVSGGIVYRRLRDPETGLSADEWSIRRRVMGEKTAANGIDPEYQATAKLLIKLVRAEIAKHREGMLPRLSSNEELRTRFGVSEGFIQRHLTSKERGQLSKEERTYRRRILSRDTNLKTFHEHGCPLNAVQRTPEQRRDDFFKGHSKRLATYEAQGGHPLTRLSDAQRQRNADKAWQTKHTRYTKAELRKGREDVLQRLRRRRGIRYNGHLFDSFQEAACGALLEKYVPNFKLQLGRSFQRVLSGAQFDFLLNGHVIEWHPVLLFLTERGVGSFPSQEMYEKFQSRKRSYSDRNERRRYVERVRGVFEYRYRQTRRATLDETPEGKALSLIVLHTPQQLFDNVIKSFGSGYPSRERFVCEFNKLTLHLSREHKAMRDRAKEGIEEKAYVFKRYLKTGS